MAYKALIFGTDKAYETMKPFIETTIKRGDFEIVARGKTENDNVDIVYSDDKHVGGGIILMTLTSR